MSSQRRCIGAATVPAWSIMRSCAQLKTGKTCARLVNCARISTASRSLGSQTPTSPRWFTLWSIQSQAKRTAVRYMPTRHQTCELRGISRRLYPARAGFCPLTPLLRVFLTGLDRRNELSDDDETSMWQLPIYRADNDGRIRYRIVDQCFRPFSAISLRPGRGMPHSQT